MQSLPRLAILALALALSACGQGDKLNVSDGEVHLSPVEGRPSAAYFTIFGGPEDVELLAVLSPNFSRVEMHESMEHDGMSSMESIDRIAIPAHTDIALKPGGKHIMVWNISGPARRLGEAEFTFVFSNGERIWAEATVVPMGTAAQ